LAVALRKANKPHPYDLSWEEICDLLMSDPAFAHGGKGRKSNIRLDHTYRIISVGRLIWYVSNILGKEPSRVDPEQLFTRLMTDYERQMPRDWLNLGKYASGNLMNSRGFSYWSSAEIGLGDKEILSKCHRMGIPNDWIDPYSVVMRCNMTDISDDLEIRLPNVIDAFDSAVFDPVECRTEPQCGYTIDLCEMSNLKRGVPEYTMGPIPTNCISIYPVEMVPGRVPWYGSVELGDPEVIKSLIEYCEQRVLARMPLLPVAER